MISPPNVLSCRAQVPADHFEEPARVQIHPATHDPSGFFRREVSQAGIWSIKIHNTVFIVIAHMCEYPCQGGGIWVRLSLPYGTCFSYMA